jgi:plasmid stability protein
MGCSRGVVVERVRLSVDVDPGLKRRVRIAAASRDLSVKEWVEEALEDALRSEAGGRRDEDRAWLRGDLSRLSEFEPYEWEQGELEDEVPVRYEPGRGVVVEGDKERGD